MTPSLRIAIHEVFPGHHESEILGIVESIGRGRTHARSVHLYDCAIRSSNGSLEDLKAIIQGAARFPETFADYFSRWSVWTRIAAMHYRAGYSAFMHPLMVNIAPVVCWHPFDLATSHSSLCFKQRGSSWCESKLFVTPWYNETVCISSDPGDCFEPGFKSGTFVSGADASIVLLLEIQQAFPKDAVDREIHLSHDERKYYAMRRVSSP